MVDEELREKLDAFDTNNTADHGAIHLRMDNVFKWLIGLLVSIVVTTLVTIWQVAKTGAERRAADGKEHTEMDTTQTSVLSRLDNVEEGVDEVNARSEARMNNHNSTRHAN